MNNERNYSVDFLKVAAIIAVVIIHVSTAYLDRTKTSDPFYNTFLFINGFSRFAVPLFFLTSGLLLGARYKTVPSLPTFYKKRILRILPSYVFWTLMYYVLFVSNFLPRLFTMRFVHNFLTGNTSYQFYFIPTICVLYGLFPLLVFYKRISLSKYFVIGSSILSVLLLYFVYYQQIVLPIYSPFKNAFINFTPFLIGIYLSEHEEKVKILIQKYILTFFGVSIFSGMVIVLESLFLSSYYHNMNFIRNQWRPSVFVYALFTGGVLTRVYELYFEKWNKGIMWLSKFSFGVFFIHVALMSPLLKYIDRYKFYDFFSFTAFLLLTISGSYVIIYLSSKIPKVGKLISAS